MLERYLAEETSTQIAASYGVTKAALSFFMLKHAEDQWKSAQLVKALTRKDAAEDRLETAETILEISRARELLKSAQWDLERVCRRVYGQDAPQSSNAVQINISLRRDGNEEKRNEENNPPTRLTSRTLESGHVQPQQYDSGAPQHEPIMPGLSVDKSAK